MNTIYLNNIVSKEHITIPVNYILQIHEILNNIDSKIKKENILRMSLYYTTRDCYDDIIHICNKWKPTNLEIEYIGNYMNYNPLIHIMVSIIGNTPLTYNMRNNNINYII